MTRKCLFRIEAVDYSELVEKINDELNLDTDDFELESIQYLNIGVKDVSNCQAFLLFREIE
jgi:hypothetical protein